MSPSKRRSNVYQPGSTTPFKLSRSMIELYTECPRCFYLSRRLGVGRPPGFPFNLNSAVDELLKKEFDQYRLKQLPHPLMSQNGIEAVPFAHPDLNKWRENFVGLQHLHAPTNLIITGAVDDVWVNSDDELIVVDYKSTAKTADIVSLDEEWHGSYKRQMEIYQWLLSQQGFQVSNIGYWVYANGDKSRSRFDAQLHFRMTVIPYAGDSGWVESALTQIKATLDANQLPESSSECDYCAFRAKATAAETNLQLPLPEEV